MVAPIREIVDYADIHADIKVCIDMIRHVIKDKGYGLREFSEKTPISKSRIARLLHSEEQKRPSIHLDEFLIIIKALDLDIVHTWLRMKEWQHIIASNTDAMMPFRDMVANIYTDLPEMFWDAFADLPDIEETPINPSWSRPLIKLLIQRIKTELSDMRRRREALNILS